MLEEGNERVENRSPARFDLTFPLCRWYLVVLASSRAADGGETAETTRDPFEASQTPPLQKVCKVKKRTGGLVEINARDGLGQIGWLNTARKVMAPISLVDFWQISPEGAKQFRQLSSRRSSARESNQPLSQYEQLQWGDGPVYE
ncbi:hypothetical protein V8C34DRAFT_308111 [Trichoderma compactum]